MIQAIPKLLRLKEFLNWYPENGHYELIDGTVVEMQPTGERLPKGQWQSQSHSCVWKYNQNNTTSTINL